MKTARLISMCLLLAVASQTVNAGDVRLYRAEETPDPREVAAMLDREAGVARPIKWRSIRLLPTQTASAEAAVEAKAAEDEAPSGFALPVQFAFDSSRVLPEATRQLDAVAEGIKLAGPDTEIVIEGHTDAVGNAQYNERLSLRRAEAVKQYLVMHHGISAKRLRTLGLGMSQPFDEANPFAGENRRVEFHAAPKSANKPA